MQIFLSPNFAHSEFKKLIIFLILLLLSFVCTLIFLNSPLSSSKDEMYSLLLKPYRYSKLQIPCRDSRKSRTVYSCGYEGCGKQFNKGWSILDHVRMHEGVKPFKCEHWDMAFTQKSNLIKHTRRHLVQKLKDRKRYKWSLCPKGFTERYNLKVIASGTSKSYFQVPQRILCPN